MILRHTQQRAAIRAALEAADRPVTPQELLAAARVRVPELGQATVYRAIKTLLEERLAVEVKVPGEPDRYERAGKAHHHHFLCRACQRMFEMAGCPVHLHNLAPKGFKIEGHDLTLYGRCPDCRTKAPARRAKKFQSLEKPRWK